jgi:uncharacterized protein YjdB
MGVSTVYKLIGGVFYGSASSSYVGTYTLELKNMTTNTIESPLIVTVVEPLIRPLSFNLTISRGIIVGTSTNIAAISTYNSNDDPDYAVPLVWESSISQDEFFQEVANPYNTNIRINCATVGVRTVTATTQYDNNNLTRSCIVKVWPAGTVLVQNLIMTPAAVTIPVGYAQLISCLLSAGGSDLTQVSWTSSNPTAAPITNTGILTSVADTVKATVTPTTIGTYTITLLSTQGRNLSTTCVITVVSNIKVTGLTMDKTTASIVLGSSLDLTCTIAPITANNSVVWSSVPALSFSNQITPTATTSRATITPTTVGTYTVKSTANDGSNKFATCVVTVTAPIKVTKLSLPRTLSLIVGEPVDINCTITPANVTNNLIGWTASDQTAVTISNSIILNPTTAKVTVTANSAGTYTLTASSQDGSQKSAVCTLNARSIAAKSIDLFIKMDTSSNNQRDITAEFIPDNTTDKTVNWTSSDTAVASLNQTTSGTVRVTAVSDGTAIITATTSNSKIRNIKVKVGD